jgi:hypothetical protein
MFSIPKRPVPNAATRSLTGKHLSITLAEPGRVAISHNGPLLGNLLFGLRSCAMRMMRLYGLSTLGGEGRLTWSRSN